MAEYPYTSGLFLTKHPNIFFTGYAILASAFAQGATIQFSVYHALIVLNLSRINNISAIQKSIYTCSINDMYLPVSDSGHSGWSNATRVLFKQE